MAYTNGNLALQPKRKPEQQPVKETKRVVKVRRMIPPSEMLRYMASVLVVVGVLVLIISRYASDYRMELQIKELNASYKQATVEVKVLQGEVAKLSDPAVISKKAKELGMAPSGDNNDKGEENGQESGR
ncbi:FtsL-like putative cell division protein [Paenibacillus pasadenensis]|uniref:septum formation initiator family protein n=1 Tax=Paenibacillus pasadenensis TaxID=217090 RepID=UPI00203E6698|nr:FtsL-like putative cell division protein [Paenibacillus pasadenensis]MCM3746314.1 FtsL-like putative cell division protein [Paenibacillus pasadenensis]